MTQARLEPVFLGQRQGADSGIAISISKKIGVVTVVPHVLYFYVICLG